MAEAEPDARPGSSLSPLTLRIRGRGKSKRLGGEVEAGTSSPRITKGLSAVAFQPSQGITNKTLTF